jgi:endonuclease G
MPGSSGSPVFNDSWHVIAIHHAAVRAADDSQHRYVNEGILMSAIKPDAGRIWPS